MRQVLILLTAVIAACGPWLQGACCGGGEQVAQASAAHGCCNLDVVAEASTSTDHGCCGHGEPPVGPSGDEPLAACHCAHAVAVAVSAPTTTCEATGGVVFTLAFAAPIPPALRAVQIAHRRARGPPEPAIPSAAVTVARTTHLLI